MSDSDYQNREQSELKHFAIKLYLQAAARIVATAWANLKYVDCCAGPWESKNSDYSDTSFGIALETLKAVREEFLRKNRPLRIECLLIEKERAPFLMLESFAKIKTVSDFRVHTENWDFSEHVSDIARYCSTPKTFSFILVDPLGWKLAGISQISPLLKLKPGEIVINLMSSFISRFVNDPSTNLSDLLGQDFPDLRILRGAELEFAIVRRYCDLIKREGEFAFVCALPVMKPDSDAFNFYLIYATRHAKGVQVFKHVEKRTEKQTHVIRANLQQRQREQRSGNLELFNSPVLYREKKYQQLAADNRGRAKASVLELVKKAGNLQYEACWAEALQYSAVYESNLRTWIDEWECAGIISVEGRKFPKEVLKRSSPLHRILYHGQAKQSP